MRKKKLQRGKTIIRRNQERLLGRIFELGKKKKRKREKESQNYLIK